MLVVGAGPAGSAAALRLARRGARVVLADRARFPRDKPCGGGLTGRALRQAPCPVDAVVEHVVDTFELRQGGRSFRRRSVAPLIAMTQRRRLDAHLVEQASQAGADVRDGCRVELLACGPASVTARVGDATLRADVLVGADGANGVVARQAGLDPGVLTGVALEGNVAWRAVPRAARYRRTAAIELGSVPGGYGWVFPKGDHVNVGVGGWGSEGPRLRRHLARLVHEEGIRPDDLRDVRGYRLPMRRPGATPAAGRVLLVGDAAGLVDPLSGDGMYEAFVSARLAAEAILAGDLAGYAAALARTLDAHARASWTAKHALDRHPALCFWAARSPGVFGVVGGLLRGDVRHPAEARGAARPPLRLIARLARG